MAVDDGQQVVEIVCDTGGEMPTAPFSAPADIAPRAASGQ
jgi:hypothetical protein